MQKVRVATWNINSAVSLNNSEAKTADQLSEIMTLLHADVIALQEVPLSGPNNESDFIPHLSQATGLKYYSTMDLSQSHVRKDSRMGLAILSRYPIRENKEYYFENPDLFVEMPNAERAPLHQKGLLSSIANFGDFQLNIICGHFPPFQRLGIAPDAFHFVDMWSQLDTLLCSTAAQPTIALMDCNTDNATAYLRNAIQKHSYVNLVHQPTRPSGAQHDYIYISRQWTDVAVNVIPLHFDHHLCFAQVTFNEKPNLAVQHYRQDHALKPTTILHLSDLHFGIGTKDDVDWKTRFDNTTREERRDRLVRTLKTLQKQIDFVVVSGDLTISGRESGFTEFNETVDILIRMGLLLSRNQFIVVPGNHDVTRKSGDIPANPKQRFTLFGKSTIAFTRPKLPTDDFTDADILDHIRETILSDSQVVGGSWFRLDPKSGVTTQCTCPILLDRQSKMLFYGFNSASVSGSKIQISESVREAIENLSTDRKKISSDVKTVLDAYEKELWVDPARVNPDELNLFSEIIDILKNNFQDFDNYIKIAVLHHHVVPVVPEEMTKFEGLTNAGRFKYEIAQASFDFILHGHKHWPGVHFQVWSDDIKPQIIISGGTIGGQESTGTEPGFNLIEIGADRSSVKTYFVPIRSAGDINLAVKDAIIGSKSFNIGHKSRFAYLPQTEMPVRSIFSLTQKSLLRFARTSKSEERGTFFGWSHQLDENRVSVMGSAYGLLILDLIEGVGEEISSLVPNVIETLMALRNADGAWSASSQGGKSRPEVTAIVLSALSKWLPHSHIEEGISSLERLLSERDIVREESLFLNARILSILAELCPSSPHLKILSDRVQSACFRNETGKFKFWSSGSNIESEKHKNLSAFDASALHTAHAIIALRRLDIFTNGRLGCKKDELSIARDWLATNNTWVNCVEHFNRPRDFNKYERLTYSHFTRPWATIALITAGQLARGGRVENEIETLIDESYDGLWNCEPIKRPIWATYDALYAIKEYALASVQIGKKGRK